MVFTCKPARIAFTEKMKNPIDRASYEKRKEEKAEKCQASSNLNYRKSGKRYVPTAYQYDYALKVVGHLSRFERVEFDLLMIAYTKFQKVHYNVFNAVNNHIRKHTK